MKSKFLMIALLALGYTHTAQTMGDYGLDMEDSSQVAEGDDYTNPEEAGLYDNYESMDVATTTPEEQMAAPELETTEEFSTETDESDEDNTDAVIHSMSSEDETEGSESGTL